MRQQAAPNINAELHTIRFQEEEWVLPRRYRINDAIRSGSYGTVISATNMETGQEVAIKSHLKSSNFNQKCHDTFDSASLL
jgi:serine/threonine protein kinase